MTALSSIFVGISAGWLLDAMLGPGRSNIVAVALVSLLAFVGISALWRWADERKLA